MAIKRACRLSNTEYTDVDLRDYEDEIKRIIEETVPGKHPKVYTDHFTTDQLERGEVIKIGRALAKSKNLAQFGKTVTTFRLFDGKNIETGKMKGGRIR